jgi:hypothetical protein
VYVPVELGSCVEGGVYPREDVARNGGRDDLVGYVIKRKGQCELVVMQRQCLERKIAGDLLDQRYEKLWPRKRKRVVHRGRETMRGAMAVKV